jgi:hypothetical protein
VSGGARAGRSGIYLERAGFDGRISVNGSLLGLGEDGRAGVGGSAQVGGALTREPERELRVGHVVATFAPGRGES